MKLIAHFLLFASLQCCFGQSGTSGAVETSLREPLTSSTVFMLATPPGAVLVQPDGKILIGVGMEGGFIDGPRGVLGWYHRGAMRLNADGTLDRTFSSEIDKPYSRTMTGDQLHRFADGRILMSGAFTKVQGRARHGHAIVLSDGRLDESFDPWRWKTNITGRIDLPRVTYSSCVMIDGTIAVLSRPVAGEDPRDMCPFAVYRLETSGQIQWPALAIYQMNAIGRLQWTTTNSLLDQNRPQGLIFQFTDSPTIAFPEVPLEMIRHAARLPDGRAILAVREAPYYGVGHATLRRFDTNWQADVTFTNQLQFQPAFNELNVHPQKDGKLLVAGYVSLINGKAFTGLMRLDTNGAIDRTFHCETENSIFGRVMDVAIQEDGRLVIAGPFTRVNGTEKHHLARLYPDGSIDSSFKPPFLSPAEFDRRRLVQITQLNKTVPGGAESTTNSVPINIPGVPNISVTPETVWIVKIDRSGPAAHVQFAGLPGLPYILQASASLDRPDWQNVATNRTDARGLGLLMDQAAEKFPMRFYRIARP